MAKPDRCFVSADYRDMEGRLLAHYTGDPVLQAELDGELRGEPKRHARNAAMLYAAQGVTVDAAKSHLIMLKGTMKPAYDGGKRLGHAWGYGMGPAHMAKTFWVTMEFARAADAMMSEKYAVTVAHRKQRADQVFGVALYECQRCNTQSEEYGPCGPCSKGQRTPIPRKYIGMKQYGERLLRTPFGRIRHFPGRKASGANAVAAQEPQGGGASIWNRTLLKLLDPLTPGPAERVLWDPTLPVSTLYEPAHIFAATGTYDSYLVECPTSDAERVLEWLISIMEQPWRQLNGLRLPAEGSIGYNWGKYDPKHPEVNPNGLVEAPRSPFTARNPYA